MRRPPGEQSVHDQAVKRIADEKNSEGWTVRADDVAGYKDPKAIGKGGSTRGRIPDVVATKPGSTQIIEVETDPDADQTQHRVFKNHVAQMNRTRLIIWLVDKRGYRQRKLYDSNP